MGRKGSGIEVRETSIRISFTYRGAKHRHTLKADGRPVQPTPAAIKHAERLAAQIRRDIELDRLDLAHYFPDEAPVTEGVTLAKHLEAWLAAQRVRTSSRNAYASAVLFWRTAPWGENGGKLGDCPLSRLKPSDVVRALASRPELAAQTHNGYLRALRSAVRLAMADGLVREDVTAQTRRVKLQRPPPDPLTPQELEAVLKELRAHAPPPVANAFEFWAYTGLRTGELIALRWPSVDLGVGRIMVKESILRGEHRDATKTGETRVVLLNSRAQAVLQRQRAHSEAAGGSVWIDQAGAGFVSERPLLRWWTHALRGAGVRYRRPYNLRHTYATMLLMAGVNPAFGAKQLGHSVQVFLRIYSRWLGGDADAREMGRLEAVLSADSSQIVPQES